MTMADVAVSTRTGLQALLSPCLGETRTGDLLRLFALPDIPRGPNGRVSQELLALGLGALLFEQVMEGVPMGRAYAMERARSGAPLVFDHGGVRTVATSCSALPSGVESIGRILRCLGYCIVETYPLPALGMTGFAFRSRTAGEQLPQFFVSELYPDRFSPEFQQVVQRVLASSRDPLETEAKPMLDAIRVSGSLPLRQAQRLLPALLACFGRQHDEPEWDDYVRLREESQEMAWISTEGQTFNHATDRVEDVDAVCREQQLLHRPLKQAVAVSASGRVRQSAFRAATVSRLFRRGDRWEAHSVPGSFWEFISRDSLPSGELDLAFDAGNATEIFDMTTASTRLAG